MFPFSAAPKVSDIQLKEPADSSGSIMHSFCFHPQITTNLLTAKDIVQTITAYCSALCLHVYDLQSPCHPQASSLSQSKLLDFTLTSSPSAGFVRVESSALWHPQHPSLPLDLMPRGSSQPSASVNCRVRNLREGRPKCGSQCITWPSNNQSRERQEVRKKERPEMTKEIREEETCLIVNCLRSSSTGFIKRPHVSDIISYPAVSSYSPEKPLIIGCKVTGFYPPDISVSWWRITEEQNEEEIVECGDIWGPLLTHPSTYRATATLREETSDKRGRENTRIVCRVMHCSLQEPIEKQWQNSHSGNHPCSFSDFTVKTH